MTWLIEAFRESIAGAAKAPPMRAITMALMNFMVYLRIVVTARFLVASDVLKTWGFTGSTYVCTYLALICLTYGTLLRIHISRGVPVVAWPSSAPFLTSWLLLTRQSRRPGNGPTLLDICERTLLDNVNPTFAIHFKSPLSTLAPIYGFGVCF